jgi:Rod binding domain-containing protein|tara:strand:+ start:222 stop:617 length:396 start_codon:yes stop_codon:yes gene_type:complete
MDTSSYYDFSSLATLKNADASKDPDASRDVLKKFEALFIDQMLQAMRKASFKSELFDSEGMKTYESMFDKEISEELARAGGLGLTKSLERQLGLDGENKEVQNLLLERANPSLSLNKSKALALYSSQVAGK